MTANPVTVEASAPLVMAAQLMRDYKIGGLPVVQTRGSPLEERRLVGIITETDLLDCLIKLLSDQAQ